MTLPQPLRGIITAMVTPLRQGGALDREGLERLIERLIGGGVHGLFILGTTGEAPALPYALRSELIALTCKLVNGRVPVLAGITDTSYADALRMARQARESGAAGVVAAPPFYYRVGQSDLLHYYTRMASEAPLPLFLYNAPSNTHHTLEVATVVQAAHVPNIVGLKDSGSNMGYFHAVQEAVSGVPGFTLLVGPEELLGETVLLGGHGGMAAGSNVWPQLFVALYDAAQAGNVSRVSALHRRVMQFDSAVYRVAAHTANPLRGLKCALSLLGICDGETALPLRPYSHSERDRVHKFLDSVDVSTAP